MGGRLCFITLGLECDGAGNLRFAVDLQEREGK
jgi:hypothetical protein